jgi:hypothetical protein
MSRTEVELVGAPNYTATVLSAATGTSPSVLSAPPPLPDLMAAHYSHSNAAATTANPVSASSLFALTTPGSAECRETDLTRTISDHIHVHTPSSAAQDNFRSTVHAVAESRSVRSLAHPLARVTYKAPAHSMKTLVGLRQHIAHYLHLYKTGMEHAPIAHPGETYDLYTSLLQSLPSSPLFSLTCSLCAAKSCWSRYARTKKKSLIGKRI